VQRAREAWKSIFIVTDLKNEIPVSYTRACYPICSAKGRAVVAHGRMSGNTFVADEVLAKHDEKYMPPEVARS